MRVFISYASEKRDLAERLALGLRNEGNIVFFDREALPAGGSFDDRIRKALQRSHLIIFLVSPESLRIGAYALTELAFTEKRWPRPAGKVLPVLADAVPIEALPPYLRSVSVLQPEGDFVAEVLDAVDRLGKERRAVLRRRVLIAAGVLLLVAVGISLSLLLVKRDPIIDDARITALARSSAAPQFRFDMQLRNRGPEALTIVHVGPESEPDVSFSGTSTEWFNVNPDETSDYSFVTTLEKGAVDSFRWRICWGYVRTEDLYYELYPQKLNVDLFMDRYRREACGSWHRWRG